MIELTGTLPTDGEFRMSGPHGDAECTRSASQISCKVVYAQLETDLPKATALLAQRFPDLSQFGPRLTVSALFQHEPVGVISFSDASPLPPKPAPAGYGYW